MGMVFTDEQIEEVKKQIFEQTKNLPLDRRRQIEQQVEAMTPEELETFVRQQGGGRAGEQRPQKGIFRMIVDGDIESKKIDENKDAVAVLSIKAISRGHVLIIPKRAVGTSSVLPSSVLTLAKKVSSKIVSKLKATSTEIQTEFLFGEIVVNVIPVYDSAVSLNSPRHDVEEKEMDEIYKKLRVVKKAKVVRIKSKSNQKETVLKLRRRIA